MQSRFVLGALGLLLILSALVSGKELVAQQPDTPASAQTARKTAQASRGPLPSDERLQAQAQAQLGLLEVQKRQLEEQAREQVRELEEQEKEQVEQLKAEVNRLVEQIRRQTKRQTEQLRQKVKRDVELLQAQQKFVAAQLASHSEASTAVRQSEVQRRPGLLPSLEEKLDRILDRLERVEKRLDRLEKPR